MARGLDKFDETFISVMTLVARVVDFSIGAMAFVEDEALEVALMHQRRTAPEALEDAKARLMEGIAQIRGDRIFRRTYARLFTPAGGAVGPEEPNLGGWACFPVSAGDRLVGVLGLGGRAVGRITRDTEAFLSQVANQSQIVMENSRLVRAAAQPLGARQPDRPVQPPPLHGARRPGVPARGPLSPRGASASS